MGLVKSLIFEYGTGWTMYRTLYWLKIKMLRALPVTEALFEKKVSVRRIDLIDINADEIKKFLQNLPDEKKAEIVSIAYNAMSGKIRAFESMELDYGNPINWQLNPLTGQSTPNKAKWYAIPDFDSKRGDVKVIWEASRFIHFYYFIRAYLITGDKKYYEAFSKQLSGWLDDNPYPYGANYKCGQECTLRMINTLAAYCVFKNSGITTREDEENVKTIVECSYKKVLSNFFYAHKCIRNNHTFSEIAGMITGAWCCNDNKRLKYAYKLLEKEIKTQFFADGGYTQYSFNYQRYSLQIIEYILSIAEKTGGSISEESAKRLKDSVLLMYQVQDGNGDVPNYGSNDGSLIFPVTACGYRDFRPTLNSVYSLLAGKRLYERGEYDEELLWFGCNDTETTHINKKPNAYPVAGLYTLRAGDSMLMVSLQDYKARPCHFDGLHIDLWHKGINILCDSGTFSYADSIGKELASTSAHNTVKAGNTEQMNKKGAFLVYDRYKARDAEHTDDSFKGTLISKNGYTHTRKIDVKDNAYVIEDTVNTKKEIFEVLLHTPCNVELRDNRAELSYSGEPVSIIEYDGETEVRTAYRSLYYLQKEEICCIILKSKNGCDTASYKIKLT